MYNAFESSEMPGGKGSTRLHMDMADAVNIMLYASPRQDGSPGSAVWDLFQAKDAAALRRFLYKTFGNISIDPIHSQHYYLDADLRKELFAQEGVKSWRVYQKPGEAVFIPAGCAHQVSQMLIQLRRLEITNLRLSVARIGLQPCGLHQGSGRFCKPRERRPV